MKSSCHQKEINSLSTNNQVEELKAETMMPENGAYDVGKNIIPFITFNDEIEEGTNFNYIRLVQNDFDEVPCDLIISENILYLVPLFDLTHGNYRISIPRNSLTNKDSATNQLIEVSFSVFSNEETFIEKAGSNRFLSSDGKLYAWGYNSFYNYPDPSIQNTFTPFPIFDNIVDFYYSYPNRYVLKSDGTLLGWGGNYDNDTSTSTPSYVKACDILGDGTTKTRTNPVTILTGVKTICGGSWHQGAILNDNSLWLWGRSICGQIGNGKTADSGQLSPVKVLDNVKSASLGTRHTVALKYDGTLWVWGGAVYIGTSSKQTTPLQKMTNVKNVSSSGTDHVLVLKNDGTAWTFGQNTMGQIGDGTTTNRTAPYQVLSDVKYIQANSWQNIAIKEDGTLWRWGYWCNGFGSSTSEKYWLSPKKILTNVADAQANSYNCFALREDGTLWGMGYNENGEIGDGTKENRSYMVFIMDDVKKFWMGGYALKNDGSLWSWGSGPLGDGKTSGSLTPIKIRDGIDSYRIDAIDMLFNLNKANNLKIDEQLVFQTILTPQNGIYNSISWSVKDNTIATITQRGILTAKSGGTTEVQLEVKTDNDTFVCSQTITVNDDTDSLIGDVNLDNKIDISDIVAIINTIAGQKTYINTSDVNKDKQIDISDIVNVINIIATSSEQPLKNMNY